MINFNLINKYKLHPPFFIYDSRVIERQFLGLRRLLSKKFSIFYSIKANPNIYILKIFRKLGANAEISSGGELVYALKAGFRPEMIVFTGPGKTDDELKQAVKKEIFLIIAESINEIGRIEEICRRLKKKQNILIRINPSFSILQSRSMFSMAGGGQKFGIDEEKLPGVINRIKDFRHINLFGLHLFSASNIFEEDLILKNTEHLFKLTKFIESKFKINLPVIDIGGGLAVNYSTKDKFNIKTLCRGLTSLVKKYGFNNKKIILESGRFLVGGAGEYIAEVIDKKTSHGEKFVIINGGVNHISRATLSKKDHAIEVLNKSRFNQAEIVNIVGNLNTPTDFITRISLPKIKVGDLISIKKVGAYGFSSGMLFFSNHTFPKEYFLSKNNKIKTISAKLKY